MAWGQSCALQKEGQKIAQKKLQKKCQGGDEAHWEKSLKQIKQHQSKKRTLFPKTINSNLAKSKEGGTKNTKRGVHHVGRKMGGRKQGEKKKKSQAPAQKRLKKGEKMPEGQKETKKKKKEPIRVRGNYSERRERTHGLGERRQWKEWGGTDSRDKNGGRGRVEPARGKESHEKPCQHTKREKKTAAGAT